MRGAVHAGLAAVVAVWLASCSTGPANGSGVTNAGPAASAAHRGVDNPTVLTTIDGATVRVPGNRPSVLVFMSTNCASCADAAKALVQVEAATKATARAAHRAKGTARFLGVDMDVGAYAQTVRGFLQSVGAAHLPTVVDNKEVLASIYHVLALSTVLIIDSAGRVTFRAINPTRAKLQAAINAAISAAS